MSLTGKLILLASAIIAIIISAIIFMITKSKIKKTRAQYRTKESHKYDSVRIKDPIAQRGDTLGELLWDLRDKTQNYLDDISLEYIINTGIRNGYKSFKTIPADNYIEQSLIKLGKIKKSSNSKELIIIKSNKEINDIFDKEYKKLVKGGMIFIVEAPKNKEIKRLLSYTKISCIRREYAKMGKGLVIVAK